MARYARASGDLDIYARMPFYTAAYLAWRLGYSTMSAEALAGTHDGDRFTTMRERYRRLLAAHGEHPLRAAAR